MGNVLRVLGIIAVSMVMSLTALFLVLFTICGGFEDRHVNGAVVLGVCGGIVAGGVALIVWIGRGIQGSRRMAPGAPAGGLAVSPVGAAGAAPAYYPAQPASIATPGGPLTGSGLQQLNLLRAGLALLAFLPLAMMAYTFPGAQHATPGLGIYLALQAVVGALPPAVLVFVLLRNPPPGLGLDATAGMTLASILFRGLFFGYTMVTIRGFAVANSLPMLFARLGSFTLIEAAIFVLALVVRRRLGPMNPGALILAVFGFLFWEGVVQAAMTALIRLVY